MRTPIDWRVRALALVAVVACLAGCASLGLEARQEVLYPRIETAWPAVADEARYGIELHPTLSEGDRVLALSAVDEWDLVLATPGGEPTDLEELYWRDWTFMRAYAQQGIAWREQNGDIGPIGADSAQRAVDWMDLALDVLYGGE